MKVLLIHNYYKQRGGEDESFEAETTMLKERGYEVECYTRHNNEIDKIPKTKVALDTVWNKQTYNELTELIRRFKPDVAHCTNLFPLISASAYKAANDCEVPVVQSLRNYRSMCLNSNFYYKGKICERCKTKQFAWPGIIRRCYKNSYLGSSVVAAQNTYHHFFKTWKNRVDHFFAPTEFARDKYIEAGFSSNRISVKPNFLAPDPLVSCEQRSFALFVGRLAPEKGLKTLVDAWKKIKRPTVLKIVGSGYYEKYVARQAAKHENIEYVGTKPLDTVTDLVGGAKFLIMPSEWFETFGRTIMEAFSRGTPVIASRLGAMSELVRDGQNGLCYQPGNSDQLASAIVRLLDDEPLRQRLGKNARADFELKYTAATNLNLLKDIYAKAIEHRQVRSESRNGER